MHNYDLYKTEKEEYLLLRRRALLYQAFFSYKKNWRNSPGTEVKNIVPVSKP